MFICNIKINNTVIKRIVIAFILLVLFLVFLFVGFRFKDSIEKVTVNDDVNVSYIEINSNNYTDILKDSHENIDKYVGKNIKFIGFVYKLYDFNENQFVLAREMIISSDNQAVIVGFLCDSSSVNCSFEAGTWVEVEGVITKGNYHGDIPVIEIRNINKTDVPCDEFVYPPSDSYINSEYSI